MNKYISSGVHKNHCMNCPCEHLLLFDSGYVSKNVLKNIKPIWTRLLVYRQFIKSVLSYENVSLLVYLFDNFTLWPELKFHSFFFHLASDAHTSQLVYKTEKFSRRKYNMVHRSINHKNKWNSVSLQYLLLL